jgi:hypothetical protein
MEGGCEVGSADSEEDSHGLAYISFERFLFREPTDRAVEDEILKKASHTALQMKIRE